MKGREASNGVKSSWFLFLVLALKIHGCWTLNSEGLALFQFRQRMVLDPFGVLADWNLNDQEPCKWSGIDCDHGRVVTVNLKGCDLEGSLGPEIGNLTQLKYLDLSKNRLSGSIPPELGQLSTLKVLDLRNNNLSGRVPTELGALHSLRKLLLCNNSFERNVPEEVEKLSSLNDLRRDDVCVAAEIECVNRKFGHCMLQNVVKKSKKSHSSVATGWSLARYLYLLPLSTNGRHESEEGEERQDDISIDVFLHRVLSEQQQYTNFIAIPPPTSSETNYDTLPTRSSGSFPAAAAATIPSLPPPVPAPSRSLDIQSLGAAAATAAAANSAENGRDCCSRPGGSSSSWPVVFVVSGAVFSFAAAAGALLFVLRSRTTRNLGPWKTGLSGQLRKAFVTGVPKLNRDELETACEDFSNIIFTRDGVAILYKGTLSNGVEIAVVSTAIASLKEWSNRAELAFRKKIDMLSRVNHKNFVNLIGYCEENEPFTRMMVFEYAPNGTLFEHLRVKELEHLDWGARMRVIMGTAYCLNHMHELNPPVVHANLNSKEIYLTDDYAAKIADTGFWADLVKKSEESSSSSSVSVSSSASGVAADADANTYSFGMMVLEVISGRSPTGEDEEAVASRDEGRMKERLVDGSLKGFEEGELYGVCEVVRDCIERRDPRKRRCSMREACDRLREKLDISPEAAMPRLSPLWWAELEILSAEAP